MRYRSIATAMSVLLLSGCLPMLTSQPSATPAPSSAPVPSATMPAVPMLAVGPATGRFPNPNTVVVPAPDSCHVQSGNRPDPGCTPGLLNPDVMIPSAVDGRLMIRVPDGRVLDFCTPGEFSTRLIRPPDTYTSPLKLRLMVSYGQRHEPPQQGDLSPAAVELDHLGGLEDIGHPFAVANLWPMPRGRTLPGNRPTGVEPNAEEKDVVETRVHQMDCRDPVHAAEYAAQLAADWHAFQRVGAPSADEPTPEPEP